MGNIAKQLLKVTIIYILGFILAYPLNMLIYTLTDNAGSIWLTLLCTFMAVSGILFCLIVNHKSMLFKKISLQNVSPKYYKNLCIQLVMVGILFMLTAVKDYYGKFMPLFGYYYLLNDILKNENLAHYLSFGTLPAINIAYFLIVSVSWIFYNLTQLLFDKRLQNR